ncbi:hypothetical protein A6769_27360 [Nostoc punctiforme NIES-2108]|uniref:Uncharacterized protein n=1 Tax=Nostoc punctiforme NIES-2108 TaxID=1356359 RepID=A0A367R7W3_NOSPU|nr:hypothetical protein A6769_27360 [Nostoc punctiforme NIES-2108]
MSWLDKNNRPINSRVSRCEDRVIVKLLREINTWVKQEQENNSYPYDIVHSQDNFNLDWLREMEIKPAIESLLIRHYLTLVNPLFDNVLLPVEFTNQQITELLCLKRNNENTLLFVQRMSELQSYKTLVISLINLHQLVIQQIQLRYLGKLLKNF